MKRQQEPMHLIQYHEKLKSLGCVICQTQTTLCLHHVLGGSVARVGIDKGLALKVSDWLVLPLCLNHHVGNEGIHQIGVLTWENKFGSQLHYLKTIGNIFELNLFELAGYSYDSKLDRYYKNH